MQLTLPSSAAAYAKMCENVQKLGLPEHASPAKKLPHQRQVVEFWREQAASHELGDPELTRVLHFRLGSELRTLANLRRRAGRPSAEVSDAREHAIASLRAVFDGEPFGSSLKHEVAAELGHALVENGQVDEAQRIAPYADPRYPHVDDSHGWLPAERVPGARSPQQDLWAAISRHDDGLPGL